MSRIPVSKKDRVRSEAKRRRVADQNISAQSLSTSDVNAIIAQYLIDNPVSTPSVYSFNKVVGAGSSAITTSTAGSTAIWNSSLESSGSDVVWDVSSPQRLTVQADGVYSFGGVLTVLSAAQRAQLTALVYKNGSPLDSIQRGSAYIRNSGTAWDYWAIEIAGTPMNLVAGDYIEVRIGLNEAANYTYNGSLTVTLERDKSSIWLERLS